MYQGAFLGTRMTLQFRSVRPSQMCLLFQKENALLQKYPKKACFQVPDNKDESQMFCQHKKLTAKEKYCHMEVVSGVIMGKKRDKGGGRVV